MFGSNEAIASFAQDFLLSEKFSIKNSEPADLQRNFQAFQELFGEKVNAVEGVVLRFQRMRCAQ